MGQSQWNVVPGGERKKKGKENSGDDVSLALKDAREDSPLSFSLDIKGGASKEKK